MRDVPDHAVLNVCALGIRLSAEFGVEVSRMTLSRGQVVVLDAPSGAGKSTVLGLVSGAIQADNAPQSRREIAGKSLRNKVPGPETMGFVLQASTLVPYISIEENIVLPCRVAGIDYDPEWLGYLIRGLGLAGLEKRLPKEVSVGQRQRAGIARAFLPRPALLLLDEPVSALDPSNVDQVERLIALLAEEAGAAIVLASHQAARGAFADEPRAHFRTEMRDGALYSIFGMEAA